MKSYRAEIHSLSLQATSPANIHPAFYERVKKSVKEEGFKQPLIVWKATVADWHKMYEQDPDFFETPPPDWNKDHKVLLVMCGNNRLKIAEELGIWMLPCIVSTDREEISRLCSQQRKNWKAVSRSLGLSEGQKTE